jgi:GT2 family glycosyltransferase
LPDSWRADRGNLCAPSQAGSCALASQSRRDRRPAPYGKLRPVETALPVSVVIPTIGRPDELRTTLTSLAACRPRAAEILVVDQSRAPQVAAVVAEFAGVNAGHVESAGRGIALAVNEGLRRATSEIVLGTHDDCSVAEDWIAVAHRVASANPTCILTGRVLPHGEAESVPSTKIDPRPHDFTGEVSCQALYPSNMVLPRSRVRAFGAFDERFETAAEDNDLCYRWLKAGHCLRYEPSLIVWHRDWRTRDELQELHVRYWREQGRFYAKHLRRQDATVARLVLKDMRYVAGVLRMVALRAVREGRFSLPDDLRGLVRGLSVGLARGWRDFREAEARDR